jgi:hypothetical protein
VTLLLVTCLLLQALQLMARAVPRMDRDESDRMVEAAAQVRCMRA